MTEGMKVSGDLHPQMADLLFLECAPDLTITRVHSYYSSWIYLTPAALRRAHCLFFMFCFLLFFFFFQTESLFYDLHSEIKLQPA